MFWIVEDTNRRQKVSPGGGCNFVRVICSILFVDRNWAYPHQPCARHAAMSPSTVTPSLFLPPKSRSGCLCSTAGVELPQPVCELPSSRILKLFSPSPFHGSHLLRNSCLPLQPMHKFHSVRPTRLSACCSIRLRYPTMILSESHLWNQ